MGKRQTPAEGENPEVVYRIEFLPEAAQDVKEAYEWYEERLSGLGEDFIVSMDEAVFFIGKNPCLNERVFKKVRRHKIGRFPFGIFYVPESDSVNVLAVIHLSRHPRSWRGRLKSSF